MTTLHKKLLDMIAEGETQKAMGLVRGGLDMNLPCDQGASVLYPAILLGNISLIRLMLEHGADPNFMADEPAATIYARKPLELARQAYFLIDQEKYYPVIKLLEEFGAIDS